MGFLPPWSVFVGNLAAPERSYLTTLLKAIKGRYPTLVEPAAGSFAVATIARELGWSSASIDTSDVSLYSTAIGEAVCGRELAALDVRLDGVPLELSGPPSRQAALVLLTQLELRTAKKASTDYMAALVDDLTVRRAEHLDVLQARIDRLAERLGPIRYRALDLFAHLAERSDDPEAIVVLNPPTYRCLAPHERILTADLRWQPAGELLVGDHLLTFDEHADGRSRREPGARRRHWKLGTITHSEPGVAECVRVELANGESVVCTADHPWLAGRSGQRRWMRADQLTTPGRRGPRGDARYVYQAFETWESETSYEAGWLAGMFDGEGSFSFGPESTHLSMVQAFGPVADRIECWLAAQGVKVHASYARTLGPLGRKPMVSLEVTGGFAEQARVLGALRPLRLLANFAAGVESRAVRSKPVRVVAVVPLGTRVIQSISTSSGTYIGEGYLMHNSGYERFFDTGGRLTWNEPPYAMFDPAHGVAKLMESVADAPALLVCLQQAPHGMPSTEPVYARTSTPSETIYYLANRPDEVLAAAGRVVRPRNPVSRAKPVLPTLPPDHAITPESTLAIIKLGSSQADYLKHLWAHRISPGSAIFDWALILDGRIAAVSGYDHRGTSGRRVNAVLMTYTFAAPHPRRLVRLLVAMACLRSTLSAVRTPAAALWVDSAEEVFTVMLTRYPEVKAQRGLMKLVERKPDPEHGFKLYYSAPITNRTPADVFAEWWKKEQQWQTSRAASK